MLEDTVFLTILGFIVGVAVGFLWGEAWKRRRIQRGYQKREAEWNRVVETIDEEYSLRPGDGTFKSVPFSKG